MALPDNIKLALELIGVDHASATIDEAGEALHQYVSEAEKAGKASEEAANKSTMSWTEFRSMYSTVLDVVRVGQQIWQETVGVTVDLANEVRQFRDVTGQTAEESSRLLQVLDDYKISAQDAGTATKKLASEGLQLNVETLASLSDRYLALNNDLERTQFLYDNFGKSGAKFAEIMAQGGDAIREANAAISDQLILSDKQLKAARDYEIALDNVNDNVLAYKVTLGNQLLPVVNDVIKVENRVNELMEEGLNPYEARRRAAQELAEANRIAALSVEELDKGERDNIVTMQDAAQTAEDLAQVQQDLSEKNKEYLSTLGTLTDQIQNYKDKESDLKDQHADLLAEKQKLLDQGWWEESDAVQAVNDKLAENEDAQARNAESFDKATKSRMLSMLEEQLAIDGLDAKETDFLLQQGLEWGLYSQSAVTAMEEAQRKVDELKAKYDEVPTEIKTIFTIEQSGQVPVWQATQTDQISNGGRQGRAFGGPVEAGKMYEVNERGAPELLNFGGKQMLMMPSSGNGYVTPVIASPSQSQVGFSKGDMQMLIASMPRIDYNELSRALVTAVQQGSK